MVFRNIGVLAKRRKYYFRIQDAGSRMQMAGSLLYLIAKGAYNF
jgi:hypothetical protein